jgi:hypothetical protein
MLPTNPAALTADVLVVEKWGVIGRSQHKVLRWRRVVEAPTQLPCRQGGKFNLAPISRHLCDRDVTGCHHPACTPAASPAGSWHVGRAHLVVPAVRQDQRAPQAALLLPRLLDRLLPVSGR